MVNHFNLLFNLMHFSLNLAARGRGRARGGGSRGWIPGAGTQAPGRGRAPPS